MVEKPSDEESAKAVSNAISAFETGFQYIGYGANQIKENAIEYDVTGKTKEGILNIMKQSDDYGVTKDINEIG